MIEHVGIIGERGFLFRTDDGATVLFVTIDKPPAADGMRTMPVSRIDFAVRSQVERVPVIGGTCRAMDPKATFRAETTCEAGTIKGRFAAQFVTIDGAAERLSPR